MGGGGGAAGPLDISVQLHMSLPLEILLLPHPGGWVMGERPSPISSKEIFIHD